MKLRLLLQLKNSSKRSTSPTRKSQSNKNNYQSSSLILQFSSKHTKKKNALAQLSIEFNSYEFNKLSFFFFFFFFLLFESFQLSHFWESLTFSKKKKKKKKKFETFIIKHVINSKILIQDVINFDSHSETYKISSISKRKIGRKFKVSSCNWEIGNFF